MKKQAKAARTETVTPSMKKTPILVPHAIGESLWPKHTGHASAARGTASAETVNRSLRIGLQISRLPLKRHGVDRETCSASKRRGAGAQIDDIVSGSILSDGPGGQKGRQYDRQRDEQQVKCPERHDPILRTSLRSTGSRSRGCRAM